MIRRPDRSRYANVVSAWNAASDAVRGLSSNNDIDAPGYRIAARLPRYGTYVASAPMPISGESLMCSRQIPPRLSSPTRAGVAQGDGSPGGQSRPDFGHAIGPV